MQSELPAVNIFNIRLDEPVTTLTDVIMAAVCFWAFIRLRRISGKQKFHHFLAYFFLLLGAGTFLGGVIGHGFLYLFSPAWRLPGWLASMVSVSTIQHASILILSKYVSRWTVYILTWHNMLVLTVLMVITSVTQDFIYTMLYISYGLLIVVGCIHVVIYIKSKARGSIWFLLAVGTGLAGGITFLFKWSLHEWFNNMDLSHIILVSAVYFFYLGARSFILDKMGLILN